MPRTSSPRGARRAVAVLALVASVVAGTVVAAPASAAEPVGVLDQRLEHRNARGLGAGGTYGQTFTAGRTGQLTAVSLQWWAPEAGDVVLSVQAAPGDQRTGPVLATATISTRAGWQTAVFDTPAYVQAGSKYAFTWPGVRVGAGSGGPNLGADYPGGVSIQDGYPYASGYDFNFRTYVTTVAAPAQVEATSGDSSATVTWMPRRFLGDAPVTGWDVQTAPSGTGTWTTTDVPSPTATTATVTGLANGSAYDVRVRARSASGEGNWSAPVTVTPLGTVVAGAVDVQGVLAVGGRLQPMTSGWTPSNTVTTAEWQVDGVTVSTSPTWDPAPEHVGGAASVVVTGTAPGHHPATRTIPLGTVAPGTIAAGAVTLRDASGAQVREAPAGVPVTAVLDLLLPATATQTYAWSVTGRDGVTTPIAGATGATYTPTGAQVARGDTLDVTVTASSPGYTDLVRRASRPLVPGAQQLRVALDQGTVGLPATAVLTGAVPEGAILTHVWTVDGTVVPGATGASYTPAAEQVGQVLAVEVTSSAPGYREQVVTTARSIRPGTQQGSVAVVGTPTVGEAVSAAPTGWLPGTAFTYAWSVDGLPVVGATDTSFTPGPEAVGRPVTVTVTAALPGYLAAGATSAPSAAVLPGTQTGTVSIEGTATSGETLVAVGSGFLPGTTLRHQWLRDGAPVDGAVDDEYAVTEADLGSRLSVVVLATLDGYDTAQAISAETAAVLGTVPTIPLPSEPVAAGAGQPFEYRVDVTGSPRPTLELRGDLPPGIGFDPATGVVAGTSTVAGTWTVEIIADNGVGLPVVTPLTVTVEAGPTEELALVTTGTTVDEEGVLHAPQGSTITVRGLGLDEWSNVTGGLPVTLTSSVETDVVEGETVTFPHASPHMITATSGAFTASVLVEVVPTAVEPGDGAPGDGAPGGGAGAGPGAGAPGAGAAGGGAGTGPDAGAPGAGAGPVAVVPAGSGVVAPVVPARDRGVAHLAYTGGEAGGLALAAGLLLLLGAGLRLGARRRRHG